MKHHVWPLIGCLLLLLGPRHATAVERLPWCRAQLCRDAEALRDAGKLKDALKLYSYIRDEVDVEESVLRKPLLHFVIAELHADLAQPDEGLLALRRYREYMEKVPADALPVGQRAEDVAALERRLSALRSPAPPQPVPVPAVTKALPVPERQARPRWRIATGAVALGLGLGLVGVGAAALSVNGHCVAPDAAGGCAVVTGSSGLPVMRFYNSAGVGGGLLAAGAVAVVAGVVLVALPGRRHSTR